MRNGVTEQELIDHSKATGAERVTLESIEAAIVGEHYFTAGQALLGISFHNGTLSDDFPQSLDLLTICTLTLWNGWTILGKSACADPANFDKELGRRLARTDAVNQIWPLMGYELKCRIARDQRLLGGALVEAWPDMDTFIGTKVINAKPMTRRNYCILRGWEVPADENPFDDGYLVEYTDRIESPPLVEGYKGYVSWSPKDVFERAYRPVRQAKRSEAATAEGSGKASGCAAAQVDNLNEEYGPN